jgi:hypothetical protein
LTRCSTTLGISIYMIVTGLEPFKECRHALAIGKRVVNGGRPSIPSSLNLADAELISGCWCGAAMSRPIFSQVSQVVTHIHCAGGSSCSDIIAVDLLPPKVNQGKGNRGFDRDRGRRPHGGFSAGCRIRRARYSICVAGKRRSAARRRASPGLDQ